MEPDTATSASIAAWHEEMDAIHFANGIGKTLSVFFNTYLTLPAVNRWEDGHVSDGYGCACCGSRARDQGPGSGCCGDQMGETGEIFLRVTLPDEVFA
jgi:hypothetical protein